MDELLADGAPSLRKKKNKLLDKLREMVRSKAELNTTMEY
jgi:hypothetical protein